MTEADWLAATGPGPMLTFLRGTGKGTDRKLRLFAVASCRRVWHLLSDDRVQEAVEEAERAADGVGHPEDLELLHARAWAAREELVELPPGEGADPAAWEAAGFAATAALSAAAPYLAWLDDPDDAAVAYAAVGEAAAFAANAASGHDSTSLTRGIENAAQVALLRDIFGNPFRPLPAIAPWNGGLVPRLAQSADDCRALPGGHLDQARLAVVCDALLDAGCPADAEILLHLRGQGPHWRGCWALDAVLARR